MPSHFSKQTVIGVLTIRDEDGCITHLLLPGSAKWTDAFREELRGETPLIRKAFRQVEEFLAGKRRDFDLPLAPRGTDFQQRVWAELLKISYGKLASYGEIARRVGSPRACRAVGMANNVNPISIIIPCHRVIGSGGKLVGYGGGLDMKRWLLNMEAGVPNEESGIRN